jgi:hypothetical protein
MIFTTVVAALETEFTEPDAQTTTRAKAYLKDFIKDFSASRCVVILFIVTIPG